MSLPDTGAGAGSHARHCKLNVSVAECWCGAWRTVSKKAHTAHELRTNRFPEPLGGATRHQAHRGAQLWCADAQPEGRGAEDEELSQALAEELHATWARALGPCMRVGVLCGGNGPGRDASLDAARMLVDHLETIHLFDTGAARSILWFLLETPRAAPKSKKLQLCQY